MSRVQRDRVAGRAHLDVQNLARRTGRPTAELLHLYALEGFLDRLARSEVADRLVLKGGMLLSSWNARRPTRDIDLAGRRFKAEAKVVRELVAAVASLPSDDGLEFDPAGINTGTIRDLGSGPVGRLEGQAAPRRRHPERFADVLEAVVRFADPCLQG